MRVLFNDIMIGSNAPEKLTSPALADYMGYGAPVTVTFPSPAYIDSAGIGYTDATWFKLTFSQYEGVVAQNGAAASASFPLAYGNGRAHDGYKDFSVELRPDGDGQNGTASRTFVFDGSGLYLIKPVLASAVTVECNGTYIGRLGMGRAVRLGTARQKEPGWKSTNAPRMTLSGQSVIGLSGYSYRSVTLDTRYKIGAEAMREIKAAYAAQIAPGYPYFLLFDDEYKRLPFYRLYARDTKPENYVMESSINRYLFSRKFDFEECF